MTAQRDTMPGPAWAAFPPMPPATPLPPPPMQASTKVALLAGAVSTLIVALVIAEIVLLVTWPGVGVIALCAGPLFLHAALTSDVAVGIYRAAWEWIN